MFLNMSKVQIVGPKDLFADVVSQVHKDGRLHIEDVSKDLERFRGQGLRPMVLSRELDIQRGKMDASLIKVNGVVGGMSAPLDDLEKVQAQELHKRIVRMSNKELLEEVGHILGGVEAKANALSSEEYEIDNQLALMSRYEPILEKIQPEVSELNAMEGYKTKALIFNGVDSEVLDSIERRIKDKTIDHCEIRRIRIDKDTVVSLVVYAERYKEGLESLLKAENITQMTMPAALEDEPFDVLLEQIRNYRVTMPERLSQIRKEKNNLSQSWYSRVVTVRGELADRIEEIRVMSSFGETEYTFLITAWVPSNDLQSLSDGIAERFGKGVSVMELEITSEELAEAPVKLNNPEWAEPFEFFYSFVNIPKYGTTDASTMMAFTFPFIFGMIVGDLVYAFAMLLIGRLLQSIAKGKDVWWSMGGILKLAGYGTIPWGFIYFEALGNLPEILLMKYQGLTHSQVVANPALLNIAGIKMPIINRMTDIKLLLGLSVLMGALHLFVGFYNGIRVAMRHGHTKHAIEKLGFVIGIILGPIMMLMGASIPVMSFAFSLGVAMMMVGVVMIFYGGGLRGAIEIFGTLSNILSYARIMAIGLVGVFLAYVANLMFVMISSAGGFAALLGGLAAATTLHLLNIVICAFSPSIHTMRLHLVECFTKFHEPADKVYKPFKSTNTEGDLV